MTDEEKLKELREHRVWAAREAYGIALHTTKMAIEAYKMNYRQPLIQQVLDTVMGSLATHLSDLRNELPGVHSIEHDAVTSGLPDPKL